MEKKANDGMEKVFESDIGSIFKEYFINNGFEVFSEVKDCDLVAIKDGETHLVEVKLRFNLELLMQCTDRQKSGYKVYAAIIKPKDTFSRRWKLILHLMKRLEIGLLTINSSLDPQTIKEVLKPEAFDRKKSIDQNKKRTMKIHQEINGRSVDLNTPGSAKKKIITAYKESCVFVGCVMEKKENISSKEIRQQTGLDSAKLTRIFKRNYYGWFERSSGRGMYLLSGKWHEDKLTHKELYDIYKSKASGITE